MEKAYKKNDVSSAKKIFIGLYIGIMFAVLYFTDIINKLSDISLNGLTVLRSVLCFIAVILLSRLLTINVIKKYKITKSYSDNLRFNINLIIVAVAIISLFYFLFAVSQNIRSIKESSQYKLVTSFYDSEETDSIIDEAAKLARRSYLIVWISIMTASAISIGLEGKCIEKHCLEDINNNVETT